MGNGYTLAPFELSNRLNVCRLSDATVIPGLREVCVLGVGETLRVCGRKQTCEGMLGPVRGRKRVSLCDAQSCE